MTTRTRILMALVATTFLVLATMACGEGDAVVSPASAATGASASETTPSSVVAADGPLDTSRFTTVLPDGWRIHADDLDTMGMMTIVYGDKYEGVYFKFEHRGSYTGKPMEDMASFAKRMKGTDPVEVTVNDRVWASTSYEYGGLQQSMMVTDHSGVKVTVTIVGEGYGAEPGVTRVLNQLVLK